MSNSVLHDPCFGSVLTTVSFFPVCGNALLNNAALVTQFGGQCNTGCEENPHEECGGPNALTVYRHGLDPITSGPGTTIQSYNGWTLSNCYT